MPFDFNMWEITALVALAIIVFGPEKLPELARKAARVIAYLRQIGNDARGQLRRELGPEFDNINLSDLNPKQFVQRHLLSSDEVADLREIRDEALSSGQLVKDSLDEASEAIADHGESAVAASVEAPPEVTVPFDPEAT